MPPNQRPRRNEWIPSVVAVVVGILVGVIVDVATDVPVIVRMLTMFAVGALTYEITGRIMVSREQDSGPRSR